MTNLYDLVIEDMSEYHKMHVIGSGGSGNVFCVEHNGNIYAAKQFTPQPNRVNKSFSSLLREAEILNRLDNPAILKVVGIAPHGFGENNPILITEYMPNNSVCDIIEHNIKLTPTQKQIILYGTARGMQYLHSKKFIHRDIKPDNILLDENFYPKIADFGFSKATPNIMSRQQSRICGTPNYAAPEIRTGSYNAMADVYAFGVTAFEIITEHLLPSDTRQSIATILNKSLLPPDFQEEIAKCISMNDRPNFAAISKFLYEHLLPGVDENKFHQYCNIFGQIDIPNSFTLNDHGESEYQKALSYLSDDDSKRNIIKAAQHMKAAADQGHLEAQFKFGMMLLEGSGVPEDRNQAQIYLTQASTENHNEAQFQLAKLFANRASLSQNEYDRSEKMRKSAFYMKTSADNGNSQSQYLYSTMLKNGYGVEKQPTKSAEYLKMSANNPHPYLEALLEISDGYISTGDIEEAKRYLQIAVNQTDQPQPFYKYGKILLESKNKKKVDIQKAVEYIKYAADQNYPPALNLYGVCLIEGIGVKKCAKDARVYFEEAANLGIPEGLYNHGLELYKKFEKEQQKKKGCPSPKRHSSKNKILSHSMSMPLLEDFGEDFGELFTDALNRLKEAADKGCMLAADYVAPLLAEKNITQAEKYYRLAADQGIAHSQYELGNMYIDGNGVVPNKIKAKMYLKKAADQNYTPAISQLADLYEQEGKYKDAVKYYQKAADWNEQFNDDVNVDICIQPYGYQESLSIKRDAALNAIEKYGMLLLEGKGIEKNLELAKSYFKIGYERGSEFCGIQLAKINNDISKLKEISDLFDNDLAEYEYSKAIQPNDENSDCTEWIQYMKQSADQGNVNACIELNEFYESSTLTSNGKGTPIKLKMKTVRPNIREAIHYCQIAADRNYPRAIAKLGLYRLGGVCCKKNEEEAISLFQKAIELGNDPLACLNYALIILKKSSSISNDNIRRSEERRAFDLLRNASEQKFVPAQYQFAKLIFNMIKNQSEAVLGDSEDAELERYLTNDSAERNLKAAADGKYPEAMYDYALYLLKVRKNVKEGSKYLRRAADSGNSYAQYKYGKLLIKSQVDADQEDSKSGKPQLVRNEKKGLEYMTKAAENYNKKAQLFLQQRNPGSLNLPKISTVD